MVIFEQVVQVSLCLFLSLGLLTTLISILSLFRLKLGPFMLVFRRFIALFAPVDGVSQVDVFRALFARKHSLGELKQALMTLDTLHEGFGDKFTTVLGWALAHRHFLLLESMHMGSIRFVALHAEGEVLTRHAIEPKHLFRYRFHAFIAAEPQIVAVL